MSEKQIAELEKELLKLKIDFDRRTTEITKKLKEIRQIQTQSDRTNDSKLKVGDWVVITNEYRSIEKGIVGQVTKFNKPRDRLWLKDRTGRTHQRAPWNVEKIDRPKR